MAPWVVPAAFSFVSGIMGASAAQSQRRARQKNADKQAKQAEEMAKWSWKETRRRERHSQYEVDIARINEESVRNFTDKMNWDEYNRKLYIRDFDY